MAKEGKRITFAYLRERAGLTQRQISIAMDITVTSVSQWETGARRPRLFPDQTQKLLQVLNCTLEELVEAFKQEWKFVIPRDWGGVNLDAKPCMIPGWRFVEPVSQKIPVGAQGLRPVTFRFYLIGRIGRMPYAPTTKSSCDCATPKGDRL